MKRFKENPKRAIRNLTDLGKRFSNSTFQNSLFTTIQEILEYADSPYYEAIQTLINNTSYNTIKNFGINIGYNNLIVGSEAIRKYEEVNGYLPWTIVLDFNANSTNDLNLINKTVLKHKSFGIYTYLIRQNGFWKDSVALFKLFAKHPDCSFVLFLKDTNLSSFQLDRIKSLTNLMISIDVNNINSTGLAKKLLSQKSLYSMYYIYDDSNVDYFTSEEFISEFLSYNSVFLFLIAKKSASKQAKNQISQLVYSLRLNQKYPMLIMDIYSDIEKINKIISK